MRIWIITMDDPLYTVDFIKDIIKERHSDIIGLTIAKGGRLKVGKKHSKLLYMISLLLIMGIPAFLGNVLKTLRYKVVRNLAPNSETVLAGFCKAHSIPISYTDNPNSRDFINFLKEKTPDIIINQSQFILKSKLLSLPKIGILNRHNALLPKNRGRLTPFWVLFKNEKVTGVSIHFVEKGIDSGPIVVQNSFAVTDSDSFNTLVKKNYKIASGAMLEALERIASGEVKYIPNSDDNATYNSVPTLKHAIIYRWNRLKSGLGESGE